MPCLASKGEVRNISLHSKFSSNIRAEIILDNQAPQFTHKVNLRDEGNPKGSSLRVYVVSMEKKKEFFAYILRCTFLPL